jgi:glycosyltransferase involved in cell wall biosynthesis
MQTSPLISIVIPSYNQAKYIAYNLDSILAQTYSNFEVIFIDDGSKDNTAEILKSYSEKDSRIKYFYQNNSERAMARSHGISKANGKYVCLVDSDDTWLPHKLETQLAVMENDPEIILCYAPVNRIDPENKPLKNAARQQEGYSGLIYKHLLMRNFIPSVTPMIRASVLKNIGEQVTDFIPYEDWDFWLRLSRCGKFHHIKEALGNYRLHPQQSVKNVKATRIEEVTIKVLDANTQEFLLELDGTVAKRASSRLRRTNDRSVLLVHEDHEDDENAEIGDWQLSLDEKDFKASVQQAYSLAYLRIAYWHLVAGDSKTAQEKLKVSLSKNTLRLIDPRFIILRLCCYLSSFNKELVTKFLGGFH